jgi:uncharacterized membrane protein HdeD (DUF308 family)
MPDMAAGDDVRSWEASWWIPAVIGVISIGAGVLAIAWPDVTLLALALITGINLLALSGFAIGNAIASGEGDERTLGIVLGVAGIVAGVIVIRRPQETLLLVIVAAGIWLVLSGIIEAIRGFTVARGHRLLQVGSGLVDVIIGVLLLALPDLGLTTVAVLVGIAFIIRGLSLAVLAVRLRRTAPSYPADPAPITPSPA